MDADEETLDRIGRALSAWGGKFHLVCGKCSGEVHCDVKKGGYLVAATHKAAALKFYRQGWRVQNVPLCPKCVPAAESPPVQPCR
jgi:hypothetical protein